MTDAPKKSVDAHALGGVPAWFCVHTQPKHEHLAAAHLRQDFDLEVYLPRIRFRRSTRVGPKWFTEALFPSYLFARFDLALHLRKVHHARGVCSVVHFGDQWPAIPNEAIAGLRSTISADEVHVIQNDIQPGDAIVISGGAFHNLHAVVERVMPGRARVAVLLEFLGRQSSVEVPVDAVVRDEGQRGLIR